MIQSGIPQIPLAKLRVDLIVSAQAADETVCYVVKDPTCGRFFRFREIEGFILHQLDGATALELVQSRVEEKFGASLPPSTLEHFVAKLGRLGLLETTLKAESIPKRQPAWIRGNPFCLRFKAFDPDRLFHYLVRQVRFFFTPSFLLLSAAFICLAAGITVANRAEIGHDF